MNYLSWQHHPTNLFISIGIETQCPGLVSRHDAPRRVAMSSSLLSSSVLRFQEQIESEIRNLCVVELVPIVRILCELYRQHIVTLSLRNLICIQ